MKPRDLLIGFLAGLVLSAIAYWALLRPGPASDPAAGATSATGQSNSNPPGTADSGSRHSANDTQPIPGDRQPVAALLAGLASAEVNRNQPGSIRRLLVDLERLKAQGPAALPAIREFLRSAQDADYDGFGGREWAGSHVPSEFVIPPSLRLGLLETVKQIGGPEAESILLDELRVTGRGVEVAYIAGALQEMAPDRHREAVFAAARDLLSMPLPNRAPNALDRSDREFLFGVLKNAKNESYLSGAREQLLQPDGRIDRPALSYVQSLLGPETVTVATQLWNDPRLPNREKASVARLATDYVGVSAEADGIFEAALQEPGVSSGQRRDLIDDLTERGLPSRRRLSAAELPVVEHRLALIDRLAAADVEPAMAQAFKKAREDLQRTREAILKLPTPGSK